MVSSYLLRPQRTLFDAVKELRAKGKLSPEEAQALLIAPPSGVRAQTEEAQSTRQTADASTSHRQAS